MMLRPIALSPLEQGEEVVNLIKKEIGHSFFKTISKDRTSEKVV